MATQISTGFNMRNQAAFHQQEHSLRLDAPSSLRIRSPLRYPGGKARAVASIFKLLPAGLNTLCSPFLGGGSIELACASSLGIKVYGYDFFAPLVNFWQIALAQPHALAERVRTYHPLSRAIFYALQKDFSSLNDSFEQAAVFFVLNRASFSGTTLSGGMSPKHPRFTLTAIERLAAFDLDNMQVSHMDFKDSIPNHRHDFLYLDPPYANGGALYGRKGDCHNDFDHVALADLLHMRGGWLLSYNDCEFIRDLYTGYEIIRPIWSYGMSKKKESNELLIMSKDYSIL